MIYDPKDPSVLAAITYGSHLYGTNGPSSDFDFKAVYLPSFKELLLGKTFNVKRVRFTKDGQPVGDHETMPADGYEAEHFSVHKLVKDYLTGQAYAMEFVYAVLQGAHESHGGSNKDAVWALCAELHYAAPHQNVQPMVGFAVKQTFDYVRRGERLNDAKRVLEVLNRKFEFYSAATTNALVRLDLPLSHAQDGEVKIVNRTLLDEIAEETGLEIGVTINQGRSTRVLKLNGREYLETTNINHLIAALEKLVESYGDRSTAAGKTQYDWKSFSHAVRVYHQVLEHLNTDWITFPRPETELLKTIKNGEMPIEDVKELLKNLDDEVEFKLSQLEKRDQSVVQERAEEILYKTLMRLLVTDKLTN